MKKFLILYLFTLQTVWGSFPPTTGKGQGDTIKPTTFNFEVPNFQATSLNGTTKLFETGNSNELVNADFEHSTVDYGWSFANGTRSSSSSALSGKKALSVALTGAVEVYQESTVNAARKSGVQMVASIWVSSADVSDLQLCSLKNGAEDKCTVAGGYVQGSGWRQLTVSFLGDSTSNGLKLKSTDTSGTVLVDQAYVGFGSPIVDFTPDTVFSAKVSSTGVVSYENTDWINGNCSISGTAVFTCNFVSNMFSVTPSCVAQVVNAGVQGGMSISSNIGTTSFSVRTQNTSTGTEVAQPFNIFCQKQGADYKTSKAYVASSSDTDWTSCGHTTSDFTGFGTVSSINLQCKRKGGDLKIKGSFISGSPTATEARINLKYNGVTLTVSSAIAGTQIAGYASRNVANNGASIYTNLIVANSGYITLSFANNAIANPLISQQGSTIIVSSDAYVISNELTIPIQGWTDSGVIVGSFQGYNSTPGSSSPKIYSAEISGTGAVSKEFGDLINGNCTSATPSVCTFTANKFSSEPNCSISVVGVTTNRSASFQVISSTSFSFNVNQNSGGVALMDFPVKVICHGE